MTPAPKQQQQRRIVRMLQTKMNRTSLRKKLTRNHYQSSILPWYYPSSNNLPRRIVCRIIFPRQLFAFILEQQLKLGRSIYWYRLRNRWPIHNRSKIATSSELCVNDPVIVLYIDTLDKIPPMIVEHPNSAWNRCSSAEESRGMIAACKEKEYRSILQPA